MTQYHDVMLDLETFDTKTSAVIASIGACYFDITTGEIGSRFYRNIRIANQVHVGRTLSDETLSWWANQSEEAQQALASPAPGSLGAALIHFSDWMAVVHPNPRVWGNGVLFDNAIMRDAYSCLGLICPWHFRNDMDVRTLVYLGRAYGENKKDNSPRVGLVHHNALDDAIYQVSYVSAIYQKLIKHDS